MNLSSGPRINARTTKEIAQKFKSSIIKMQQDGLTFQGRMISTEATISALLVVFLELSYEEQRELIFNALPALKEATK